MSTRIFATLAGALVGGAVAYGLPAVFVNFPIGAIGGALIGRRTTRP